MKVMRASNAPMLNSAGSDTTSANSSFLMPLAAWKVWTKVDKVTCHIKVLEFGLKNVCLMGGTNFNQS